MSHETFVRDVGAQLGEGQTYCQPELGQFEWRGLCRSLHTRVAWDESHWKVVVKLAHEHRPSTLTHEPGSAPRPGSAPAAEPIDENDIVRVFVAREVFIETFGWTLRDELIGYHGLPVELAQHITTAMPRDRVHSWCLLKAQIEAGFLDPAGDPDPLGSVVRFTQLIAWIAEHLQKLTPRARAPHSSMFAPGEATQLTCAYCTSMFLLTAAARCPNCGAPSTG